MGGSGEGDGELGREGGGGAFGGGRGGELGRWGGGGGRGGHGLTQQGFVGKRGQAAH